MERKYISSRTVNELYKFLKDDRDLSYSDLTNCFHILKIDENSLFKPDPNKIAKYNFLDRFISSLDLMQFEQSESLALFIEQVCRRSGSTDFFAPQAKDLLLSLQRDGWNLREGLINWQSPLEESLPSKVVITIPSEVNKLLETLIVGLPNAMYPFKHRRKDGNILKFDNEYDVQDLLHSLLRVWIPDVRTEDYVPSYAGTNSRVDFILPDQEVVIEVKYVRDKQHARKIGDEITIDISHYKNLSNCKSLWVVIYDPQKALANPGGLKSDLERKSEKIKIKAFVIH